MLHLRKEQRDRRGAPARRAAHPLTLGPAQKKTPARGRR